MSHYHEEFDPECQDCRPCILDSETKQVLPDTHPDVVRLLEIWKTVSRAEREAFFRVTVQNGRDANDLHILQSLQRRIQAAMLDPSERSN
jgi:hypothetical protein